MLSLLKSKHQLHLLNLRVDSYPMSTAGLSRCFLLCLRQLSLMLARALGCAVAHLGVEIYPNNSLRRNQMNYCKILTYLCIVRQEASLKGSPIDWDTIERLHDALNDAEINELNLIYSGE